MVNGILRRLAGANLEVVKFGMYIMFPIGWMYYFGTNLEDRFRVPDFWPKQENSHRIPFEREEIASELERMKREQRERRKLREKEQADGAEVEG